MPRTLTITIPDDVYKRLEDEAKAKGVTLDDIIAERLGGVCRSGDVEKWIDEVQGLITDFKTEDIMELTRE